MLSSLIRLLTLDFGAVYGIIDVVITGWAFSLGIFMLSRCFCLLIGIKNIRIFCLIQWMLFLCQGSWCFYMIIFDLVNFSSFVVSSLNLDASIFSQLCCCQIVFSMCSSKGVEISLRCFSCSMAFCENFLLVILELRYLLRVPVFLIWD